MAWAARALQSSWPRFVLALPNREDRWDRGGQTPPSNCGIPCNRSHHHGVVNRSLPFVHTARRFNRLGVVDECFDRLLMIAESYLSRG